ncbi:MAG: hypothetical protein K2X47_05435 [Bdellovibrionales bacterium]|nr:hypothetical protein [Bdellovibrionales bacterium]
MDSRLLDIESRLVAGGNQAVKQHINGRKDFERRKWMVLTTMATIIFLVTATNSSLFKGPESSPEHRARGIASVDPSSMENSSLTGESSKEFIQKMEQDVNRSAASLGATPSLLDQMRFGLLEGKYLVKLAGEGEKQNIESIEFISFNAQEDRPKYLKEKEKFLSLYMELLGSKAVEIGASTQTIEGDILKTEYSLLDQAKKQVAVVRFQDDSFGRLIRIDVEAAAAP